MESKNVTTRYVSTFQLAIVVLCLFCGEHTARATSWEPIPISLWDTLCELGLSCEDDDPSEVPVRGDGTTSARTAETGATSVELNPSTNAANSL